jgi:hypothetical protein
MFAEVSTICKLHSAKSCKGVVCSMRPLHHVNCKMVLGHELDGASLQQNHVPLDRIHKILKSYITSSANPTFEYTQVVLVLVLVLVVV